MRSSTRSILGNICWRGLDSRLIRVCASRVIGESAADGQPSGWPVRVASRSTVELDEITVSDQPPSESLSIGAGERGALWIAGIGFVSEFGPC